MSSNFIQIIREEHAAVAAVLRSALLLLGQAPAEPPERFFSALRAMLFYIDEFPERLHHPRESDLLFPKLVRAQPALMPVIERLERDHMHGEGQVRELLYLLAAWEFMGAARKEAFAQALAAYVRFYLDHMRVEESELLPVAGQLLGARDHEELDRAFGNSADRLAGGGADAAYDRLFSRIVLQTPAPVGVGEPMAAAAAH